LPVSAFRAIKASSEFSESYKKYLEYIFFVKVDRRNLLLHNATPPDFAGGVASIDDNLEAKVLQSR
jgi:hypothetical protein